MTPSMQALLSPRALARLKRSIRADVVHEIAVERGAVGGANGTGDAKRRTAEHYRLAGEASGRSKRLAKEAAERLAKTGHGKL